MRLYLFRYVLALLCLILAFYFFWRGPSAVWTQETDLNTYPVDFTADGDALWTYRLDVSQKIPVITFQRHDAANGNVLMEYRVVLEVSCVDFVNQGQIINVSMSNDGKVARLHVPQVNQAKFSPLNMLIDLTNGAIQNLPDFGSDPGVGQYQLSPSGKWLSLHDGRNRIILDRHTLQTRMTLENEVTADGIFCVPSLVIFSPDEKHFAVAWESRYEKGIVKYSEIRLYSSDNWKEHTRIKTPRPLGCSLANWEGNVLWFYLDGPGNASRNEFLVYLYCFDTTAQSVDKAMMNAELVAEGYSRSYANPHYVREYRMPFKHGNIWYSIKDFREASQLPWIESLRDKSVLSGVINQFLPRETLAIEFYQASTQHNWNRISLHPNSKFCISPDGKWIAGLLRYQNQLCLYSTAPLIRWPGYLFIVVIFFVLFWRRSKHIS